MLEPQRGLLGRASRSGPRPSPGRRGTPLPWASGQRRGAQHARPPGTAWAPCIPKRVRQRGREDVLPRRSAPPGGCAAVETRQVGPDDDPAAEEQRRERREAALHVRELAAQQGVKRTPRAVATTRLRKSLRRRRERPTSRVAKRRYGGCQGVDAETSAFGGGVGRAHKSVRYVVTCAFSGNDGFVLSGRAPVVSNSAGLARGQTCASSGSSASKKKANHGCLDKMHVTIGYRARSPGGRNRRQNPTVWLPSLSVSTNVYTDGFARVSGTSDVRLLGTYSGKVALERHSHQRSSDASDLPSAANDRRSSSLGAGAPEASTETPTQKNARASKPARGSPRDAIASAQFTLGSSERVLNVSFRNTIGRDFCLHPSSVVDDRKTASHHSEARTKSLVNHRADEMTRRLIPACCSRCRAARAAPRDRRPGEPHIGNFRAR